MIAGAEFSLPAIGGGVRGVGESHHPIFLLFCVFLI